MSDLQSLSRGFRHKYLDYAELTAQLRAWADAFPEFVSLASIGKTEKGRELWVLTIGHEPSRIRPAAWIDGNMHAAELTGSSVCLAVAEELIALHLAAAPHPIHDVAREGLTYIMPRVSPDGAEAVLRDGRYVRSVPRDTRPQCHHPRWIASDIDGDGLALVMRQEDPAGDMVEAPEFPGLLVPREIGDEGPFYRLYPEGTIAHWDGATIPDPSFLSDNDPDLNRNFPYRWAPEPAQVGAGVFPLSEVESRAMVEFATAHPNIFTWVNLHTFGGVFIRPLGHAPDSKMHAFDRAVYAQVEQWADELTGYPTVSGFEEFTYEPDKPLHGDLTDFTHHQRGCLTWVCELWDLFEQAGLGKRKRFVDRYSHVGREDLVAIAKWDAEHNEGRVVRPWKRVLHPQIGEVEVGGIDPRIGLWNPPPDRLDEICRAQSELFVRAAALSPRLRIEEPVIESLEGGLHRVEVRIANHGYLPTYGLEVGRNLPWNEGLWVDAEGDVEIDVAEVHREIGHLDGWGRGRFGGFGALYYSRSRGSGHARRVTFVVRGSGVLRVRAGSCRVGEVVREMEL